MGIVTFILPASLAFNWSQEGERGHSPRFSRGSAVQKDPLLVKNVSRGTAFNPRVYTNITIFCST